MSNEMKIGEIAGDLQNIVFRGFTKPFAIKNIDGLTANIISLNLDLHCLNFDCSCGKSYRVLVQERLHNTNVGEQQPTTPQGQNAQSGASAIA
jgi:hypothetical protein